MLQLLQQSSHTTDYRQNIHGVPRLGKLFTQEFLQGIGSQQTMQGLEGIGWFGGII